jgi:hypothetical protein
MDPRAGLDAMVRRKIPIPYRDSNPQSCGPYSSAVALSYPGSWIVEEPTSKTKINFTCFSKQLEIIANIQQL